MTARPMSRARKRARPRADSDHVAAGLVAGEYTEQAQHLHLVRERVELFA